MSGKFLIRVRLRDLRPDRELLGQIFRLGLPSGIQNCVINIANVVVQANINAFGDLAMAGCGAYFKIEGFMFLPVGSLTMAITTFVGQNTGAGQPERAKKGAWLGIAMAALGTEAIGVLFFLFAPQLIGLFSPTPEVVAFGARQVRTEALFYAFLGFAHAAGAALRGAGRAVTSMGVLLSVWCFFRIAYITVMVSLFQDITVVFTAYPVTWGISTVLFALILWRTDWVGQERMKNFSQGA